MMFGWLATLLATGGIAQGQPMAPSDRAAREASACTVVGVIGGDGLRCAETRDGRPIRLRLAGIRPRARNTAAQLGREALHRIVMCRPAAPDARGPTVYCIRADGVDLACAMVASGTAVPSGPAWQPQRCRRSPDAGRERIMEGPRRP